MDKETKLAFERSKQMENSQNSEFESPLPAIRSNLCFNYEFFAVGDEEPHNCLKLKRDGPSNSTTDILKLKDLEKSG
jgi:hypothetical protein